MNVAVMSVKPSQAMLAIAVAVAVGQGNAEVVPEGTRSVRDPVYVADGHTRLGLDFYLPEGGEATQGGRTSASRPASTKPRLLVLTDIGGDPDDRQSTIRLLLYANEFELEGLIASASGTPGELKEKTTRPELIRELVEAYGRVQANLRRHAAGYPEVDRLLALIKSGNSNRGLEAIGKDGDTEGSRWIIQAADRDDPRPLNVAIWGGQTDLAQALWRVREDRGEAGVQKWISRLRIHDIADQDGIAAWIWKEFPGLFYILDKAPEGKDRREAVFRGMYLGGDESLVSREWMETHIRQNHGPLGALYPPRTWTAPNPHSAIKEGDTPSWFYFLSTGANDPEHPEWGGWGGRFQPQAGRIFRDARDRVGGVESARATVWRWRPAYQADFQARLDWCVANKFHGANHAPTAVLNGDRTLKVLKISVRAGEEVDLSAAGSSDPDGDSMQAYWFVYPEAGTYHGTIEAMPARGFEVAFPAPVISQSETVHVLMELRDHGEPPLRQYRRAVITVVP